MWCLSNCVRSFSQLNTRKENNTGKLRIKVLSYKINQGGENRDYKSVRNSYL